MEDVGDVISKGFNVWIKSLNLGIPFLLSFITSLAAIASVLAVIAFSLASFQSLNSTQIENIQTMDDLRNILPMIEGFLPIIILAFLLTAILILLIGAFFTSGAIGMCMGALQTGKTSSGEMWVSGKKNFANMFMAYVLMGLLTIAGLIFLLPGAALIFSSSEPNSQGFGLIILGLIIFILYALIISLLLSIAPYALVLRNTGPTHAIMESINFFMYNKFDVFVLWLVIMALSIGLQMIGGSLSAGNGLGFSPISIISGLANMLVLAPLSALWWTRLYMDRRGMLNEVGVIDSW